MSNQAALQEARAHHQAGRLPETERIYERILASVPRHADARQLLGVAAHQGGEHLFATRWTYKYFQDESDGHILADNGAASLNLWITPGESDLETDAGGLVLWNKAVPDEYFDVTGEEMMQMSRALVAEPDAEPGYVAYACNRAMMFRCKLLHKTHRLKFKDGYPRRRVSITFLYGKPGQ